MVNKARKRLQIDCVGDIVEVEVSHILDARKRCRVEELHHHQFVLNPQLASVLHVVTTGEGEVLNV